MTGEEKAAAVLLSLPAEAVTPILVQLGPERSGRLRACMARLESVPPAAEQTQQLFQELEDFIIRTGTAGRAAPESEAPASGDAYIPSSQSAGSSRAQAAVPTSAEMEQDPLAALRRVDMNDLALALRDEQPRTIAVLLNHLNAKEGGEILKRLPPEQRREVSPMLASAPRLEPTVIRCMVQALITRIRAGQGTAPPESPEARHKRLADMIRAVDKPERMEILTALEQSDPPTAAGIKQLLYQFEDLLNLDDRSMQKILADVDAKTLATALKGASEDISARVMSNLSKRARESLAEEMEFLSSVPSSQVKDAQKTLVDVLQRLDQAGELVMLS